MYLDFYHLKQAPFPRTPDPAFLFLSPSHRKALAAITYGVEARQGFVLITGEAGVGKTMILRAYLEKDIRPFLHRLTLTGKRCAAAWHARHGGYRAGNLWPLP
jgi:ABC-type phosphate/phosphonate transport system ATPase subunit